jgi:c-di-GMP-binding flagellar brake protein YcgR
MLAKKEKRKTFRLNAYHLAKYRLSSQGEWQSALASIGDISAGGARLRTEEKIARGSVLEMFINFPQLSSPVFCKAKVVWVKKIGKDNRFDMGLEFLEIDDLLRQEINRRIDYVRRRSE